MVTGTGVTAPRSFVSHARVVGVESSFVLRSKLRCKLQAGYITGSGNCGSAFHIQIFSFLYILYSYLSVLTPVFIPILPGKPKPLLFPDMEILTVVIPALESLAVVVMKCTWADCSIGGGRLDLQVQM